MRGRGFGGIIRDCEISDVINEENSTERNYRCIKVPINLNLPDLETNLTNDPSEVPFNNTLPPNQQPILNKNSTL
jgi:hypothetical protein